MRVRPRVRRAGVGGAAGHRPPATTGTRPGVCVFGRLPEHPAAQPATGTTRGRGWGCGASCAGRRGLGCPATRGRVCGRVRRAVVRVAAVGNT